MTVTKTHYHREAAARSPAGLAGLARFRLGRSGRLRRRLDERGEGVISAAIAVLVMAFIGVAMWVAFKTNTPIHTRVRGQL